jgi:hypothetical protein
LAVKPLGGSETLMNARTASLIAMVACAGIAGAQDEKPVFEVIHKGIRADVLLNRVTLPSGMVYEKFIHASSIDHFNWSGGTGKLRVIAGTETTNTSGSYRLEDLDGDGSSVSQDDLDAFSQRALDAFQNVNLNNYIDINSSGHEFSCIVTFERDVKDNDPDADQVPEFLYFERGGGGSNSWLVIEALDDDGNVIGRPRVMAPTEAVSSDPPAMVDTHNSSMQPRNRPQEMTAVAVDLSELGVTQLRRLRMRNPIAGVDRWMGTTWLSGETAPDFKLLVVQTYDVETPHYVMGD